MKIKEEPMEEDSTAADPNEKQSMVWINEKPEANNESQTTMKIKEEEPDPIGEPPQKVTVKEEPVSDHEVPTGQEGPSSFETIFIKKEVVENEATPVEEVPKSDNRKQKCKCKMCDFRCANQEQLRKHVQAEHSDERNTRCNICNVIMKGAKQLEKHFQDEHQGFECECKICLTLYRKGHVAEHRTQCPGRLVFRCGSCGVTYVKKEGFLKHLEGHEELAEAERADLLNGTRIKELFFSCIICADDRAFEKDAYWEHVNTKHDGHHIRCLHCDRTFKLHSSRNVHMKKFCKSTSAMERFVAEELQCPECPKKYKNRASLEAHVAKTHGKNVARCKICYFESTNRNVLRYHRIKSHTDPKLSCPHCAMKFHFITDFRRHVQSHENRRQIICDLCGLGFNNTSNLASHVKYNHQRASTAAAGDDDAINRTVKSELEDVAEGQEIPIGGMQGIGVYTCIDCKLDFASKRAYMSHMNTSVIHRKKTNKCKN